LKADEPNDCVVHHVAPVYRRVTDMESSFLRDQIVPEPDIAECLLRSDCGARI
jgi:hypothetical protein